ncbi:hypothetical protein OT109_11945 [Phycisphaeraceae bacterium D3-23]
MLNTPARRVLAALLLALLLPVSGSAFGQVLFNDQRSVENRDLMRRHQVTIREETRVKLTYDADKTASGCHMRVRIYRRIDHGDRDYRIVDTAVRIQNNSDEGELYATLPPGDYRFDVDAKRMDIHVTLEVAADEEDDG